MTAGLLIVLSGPSGVGKGTVCRRLLRLRPSLQLSVSLTTRPPRTEEKSGRDYNFTSSLQFQKLILNDAFLEWAIVYGHYYGTLKRTVEKYLEQDKEILLEIDVQGALQVRRRQAGAVLIFLAPPSMETLRRRIAGRGTEDSGQIDRRLKAAQRELAAYRQYDYLVVNGRVEEAAASINMIIEAERCKVNRGARPPFSGGEER